jgi:hypothetical protein
LEWAKNNTTLVYPLEVKIVNKCTSLYRTELDRSEIPVKVGGKVRALQVHPASPEYLVVAQEE